MPTVDEIIASLEQAFDPSEIRQREGGFGKMLDYIDWPAAVRRLNTAAGSNNWSFEVSDLQFKGDLAAGLAICKGRLTIEFPDGTTSTKEQYGGNAYGGVDGRRGMSAEDAAKGAGSDALKKCAALFGIALDLAEKGGNGQANGGGFGQAPRPSQGYDQNSRPSQGQASNNGNGQANGQASVDGESLYCEECGEPLTETRFKDQTVWSPAQLAAYGRRKHSKILDMSCYRQANQAKRQAEEALQQVPF